jgi:two-component system chemotaxis response regulator CheB
MNRDHQPVLPRDLTSGESHSSDLVCPDCGGPVSVRSLGKTRALSFRCRIGHAYSLGELLAAKEHRLEERLWMAVRSLEELGELLEEMDARGLGSDAVSEWHLRSRAQAARSNAGLLRWMLARERPVVLRGVPGWGPGGQA